MSFLKRVAFFALFFFSTYLCAANNGSGRYYVENIIPNSQAVQGTVLQYYTGYNNACGPTALLFLDNHYVRNDTGYSPPHLLEVSETQDALDRLYVYLNQTTNTATSLDQLKHIARNKWGYGNVVRMSAANTVQQNINYLISYLSQDIPALGVIRGNYYGNPVSGGIDHIVIIFAYNYMEDEYGNPPFHPNNTRNNDLIEYYEPFYGYMGVIPRSDIHSNGNTSAMRMANFSFLAVGR